MLETGFDKEVTAIVKEWLDISKERDMALFNKMELQNFKLKWNLLYRFRDAFIQEVRPLFSEELYRRIILMSYKLLGADAYLLTEQLVNAIPDLRGEAMNRFVDDTMKEVYGDEAVARTFSVRYSKYCIWNGKDCVNLPLESEPYLKAAEVTSKKDYVIKLMLCANALEYMPLPEGKGTSAEALKVIEMIWDILEKDIVKKDTSQNDAAKNIFSEEHFLVTMALAPASYFDEQAKAHFLKCAKNNASAICKRVLDFIKRPKRTLEALFSLEGAFTLEVLDTILKSDSDHKILLETAAKLQTETFKDLISKLKSVKDITEMNDVLRTVKPDEVIDVGDFKNIAKEKTAEAVADCFKEKDKIKAYLNGEISIDEIWSIVKSAKLGFEDKVTKCKYLQNCGEDDFIIRCVAVLGGSGGSYSTHLNEIVGSDYDHRIKNLVDKMLTVGVNVVQALDICGNIEDMRFCNCINKEEYLESFSKHMDELAAQNLTKCNATAKTIALTLFKKNENQYRRQIMALAGDSAQSVRDIVAEIVIKHPDWNEDVLALLQSKKGSERDFALSIIEKQGAKAYISELKKALSEEKTDKLKARMGSILATVSDGTGAESKESADDIVKSMTGGKKTAKLDWLFDKPFTRVHTKNGDVADDNYLKALMLCFANNVGLKDPNADVIASKLVEEDVCRLANETLDRWLRSAPEVKSEWMEYYEQTGHTYAYTVNAQAKYKWVLYFASVYGGKMALDLLDGLMDHWPLWQKGALAKEIPYALILNGSSEYIMKVEKMSRKHRFNSIRKASSDALLCAAEKLGISSEEFADRMVPDMEFDGNMCRTFDYGSRQFKVYISAKLEPEIYCDDKKLKSMPKPSESDDKVKADAAYKEFTDMKKLMKTIVATQLVRLEKTMCTARCWTSENWKKLFVSNPIMHRFAIGLVWGIYKEDKLETSFRYLEDGSFNTVDDEEFTLPETAQIGLVHPIELSEKELAAWKQQLKDYEVAQPFAQLERGIYRPTDEEKGTDCIERFSGKIKKSMDLASAMNKIGWNKGQVGDGAMFDDFFRDDLFTRSNGIKASLLHSGMSVDIYRGDEIRVTIGKLYFCQLPGGVRLNIADLKERYFSEIMRQLSMVLE